MSAQANELTNRHREKDARQGEVVGEGIYPPPPPPRPRPRCIMMMDAVCQGSVQGHQQTLLEGRYLTKDTCNYVSAVVYNSVVTADALVKMGRHNFPSPGGALYCCTVY